MPADAEGRRRISRMEAIVKQEGTLASIRDRPLQHYYLHEEEEVHLRDYCRIILKRRWTVITFFVIITTTVTIYTLTLIPNYRAAATIKIDRERPQILSFQEIGLPSNAPYDPEFMGTSQKLLQTRSLAKRVADILTASGQPVPTGQERSSSTEMREVLLSWLKNPFRWPASITSQATAPEPIENKPNSSSVDSLLSMLTVEPVRGSNLVRIAFSTPAPELSARLANTWAKAFIDQSLDLKYHATIQASDWLSKQLQEVLVKLEQSEAKLHAFAKERGILTIGEKKDIVTTKLADLSEALTKAQGERITKEALYRQSQGMGFESIPVVLENGLISNLKTEYYKLDSEYQRLSETFKPDYPKMARMREGTAQLKRRLDSEIGRVVEAIKQDYEAGSRKEKLLQAAVEEQKRAAIKLNQDFAQYDILKREVDTNRQIYASILERQKQAGVSVGLATSNVQIVDMAETPRVPFSPNRTRSLLLGIAVGLTVGIGMAFFFDYLDNTVKSPEELEHALGIPSLALIPMLSSTSKRKELQGGDQGDRQTRKRVFELIAHRDGHSMLTEAFRTLRTAILYSSPGSPPKSILFTSAQSWEGKTGTAINTAITLSQLSYTVLLIDGDMRRPCCHNFLQIPLKPGLSDYLTGHADLASIIKRTALPHLYSIPAGIIPVNPAELLASARMREAVELLSLRFDYIIVDSPPVLGIADALILSTLVKGVILVTRGGRTPREMVKRAHKRLVELNAPILGTVLNNVDMWGGGYPYYYQRHPYQEPDVSFHQPQPEDHEVKEDFPTLIRDSGAKPK